MNDETLKCLNCGATENEAPVVQWRYQGREFVMCADCLPIIIHKRHLLMEKLAAGAGSPSGELGERTEAE